MTLYLSQLGLLNLLCIVTSPTTHVIHQAPKHTALSLLWPLPSQESESLVLEPKPTWLDRKVWMQTELVHY